MKNGKLMIIACVVLIGFLVPLAGAVEPLWKFPADPGNDFSMVVVSEDGSTVVAGGDQLTAVTGSGKKKWTGWSSTNLDISRNGSYIVSSQAHILRLFSGDGIMLWDQSIVTPVTDLSITPDGALIAVAGSGTVRTFFNSGSGYGENSTPGVHHVRISPAKDQVIVTTERDVQRFNLSIVPLWYDDNSTQDLLDISGDGTSFVTVTYNRVRRYHAGGALYWEKVVPGGNALGLAYSRDGSTIVLGRDDNSVRVLDRNGTLLWTAEAGNWVTSVDVSDDGSTIVAGSMDRNLYVFDRAGKRLGTFTAAAPIKSRSVGVSGDGSVIAAADLTAVYGFSRSQFEQPVTTAPPTTVPATTLPTTTVTTPPVPETTPAPVTATPTTPRAFLSPAVLLASLGVLVLFRSARRT